MFRMLLVYGIIAIGLAVFLGLPLLTLLSYANPF